MKRLLKGLMTAAAMGMAGGATPLLAENVPAVDAQPASMQTQIASLEAELAALKTRLGGDGAMVMAGSYGYGAACGTCGSSCGCDPCCCEDQSGWTAGVDLLFLKPRFNDNQAFTVIDLTGVNRSFEQPFEHDHDLSVRYSIGYTGSDGLGARVRYFAFDDGADESFAPAAT
ncbi:MAG: hypothetical protein KY476_23185, partial [Planctomycetes bacterium]|nr:hypothetical protein [Planctomycetota bacterium]